MMIRTTPFGRVYEPYMYVPDEEPPCCCMCGERLTDEYWDINDKLYCLNCEDAAIDALWQYQEVMYRKAVDD